MNKKFTQEELEAAFKQMGEERSADFAHAKDAAGRLNSLLGWTGERGPRFEPILGNAWYGHGYGVPQTSPYSLEYKLTVRMCQYDDWHGTYQLLGKVGLGLKPWSDKGYPNVVAVYDLSGDPTFLGTQKQFDVTFTYYDSHVGGY